MPASDTALRLVSAAVIVSLKSGMSPETPVVSISIICSNFFLLSSDTSAVRSVYIRWVCCSLIFPAYRVAALAFVVFDFPDACLLEEYGGDRPCFVLVSYG